VDTVSNTFDSFGALRSRNYMFDPNSVALHVWHSLITVLAVYSVTYVPLLLALPQTRWDGHESLESLFDAFFIADVGVRLRTAYLEHGYLVTAADAVAFHYLKGWLVIDALAAVPFDQIARAALNHPNSADAGSNSEAERTVRLLQLLRVLRMGHLLRKMVSGGDALSRARVQLERHTHTARLRSLHAHPRAHSP
jgi:hypothetical protein